jgi:hypothetical protein
MDTAGGTTVIPNLKKAYEVYNVDLSAPGATFDVTVDDLTYRLVMQGGSLVSSLLLASGASSSVVVDVTSTSGSAHASYDESVLAAGSSLNLNTNNVNSNYVEVTAVRQTNQTTGVAHLSEIRMFSSGGAVKTTIWVEWVY